MIRYQCNLLFIILSKIDSKIFCNNKHNKTIGAIDEASRVWMESSVITIDENYSDASSDDSTGIGLTSRHSRKEYFMMNYEKRSIDIDRLDAPLNHVITGVRFRNLGGHLNLEAQISKFTFIID